MLQLLPYFRIMYSLKCSPNKTGEYNKSKSITNILLTRVVNAKENYLKDPVPLSVRVLNQTDYSHKLN